VGQRLKHFIVKSTPSAFGNPVFLRIWLVNLISGTAVAAHDTAATWMMNLMSPSGLLLSLMASLASLPFFLFTLPAGALADALNEGRIMRLANLWLAGCAGLLALLGWAGKLNPPLLLTGVFLLGVGFAINAPAWASVVPQIVTDAQLPSASALNGMQLNVSGILGPALAGVLLLKVGAPAVFGLNAVGFLLVSASIPRLEKASLDRGQALRMFAHAISGALYYVGQNREVRNILFLNVVFSSFVVVVPALTPVLLLKELHLDGSSLGLVFASLGVGSVASAIFVIPRLRSRFSSSALIVIAQLSLSGIYLLLAMVHHCAYCLVPMALAGASWTLAGSELWVMAQRAMQNSMRARVSAIMMIASQGAMTLAGIIWGFSGRIVGTRSTLLAAGLLFFTITAGGLLLRRTAGELSTTVGKGPVPHAPAS
jgi:MFS family permease